MKALRETLGSINEQLGAAREDAERRLDARETEVLQLLGLSLAALDASSLNPYVLRDVAKLLRRLDAERHPWAVLAASRIASRLRLDEDGSGIAHQVEVGRRVLSAHRFLDGGSGHIDFGETRSDREGELSFGVGLSLHDGSLQHFLTALARHSGYASPVQALQPYFDHESEALADAIEKGHAALGEFLRSLFVFRYDTGRHRLLASLPESWQARFNRLASSLEARRLQLGIKAGHELTAARGLAELSGLQSLRGLALAFDLGPIARQVGLLDGPRKSADSKRSEGRASSREPEGKLQLARSLAGNERPAIGERAARGLGEGQRLSRLADRILQRLQGPFAEHWSERIRGLVEGEGEIGGRHYEEAHFLGAAADEQPWQYAPDHGLAEARPEEGASRVPLPGHDYLVQAGDRLSDIARRAYSGKGDYRLLLSANPQLRSPAQLAPGARLVIPPLPSPAVKPVRNATRGLGVVQHDGEWLRFAGRLIGPWRGRSPAELEALSRRVAEIDSSTLPRARANIAPDGWNLSIDGQILAQIDERDAPTAQSLFPEAEDALDRWTEHVAAQLRGDLVLAPGHHLAFGTRPLEPQRHRWVRAALLRALEGKELDVVKLRVPPSGLWVDLVLSDERVLVRLEIEDLEAIRQQPYRRLGDLGLEPMPAALSLARLWLAGLRRQAAELVVWPLADARRYPSHVEGDEWAFLAPVGTAVFPVAAGVVRHCGLTGSAGLAVLIEHPGSLYSRSSHLSALSVRPGQVVSADRPIGRVGMSGEVTEPRLAASLELRASGSEQWRVADAKPIELRRCIGTLWPDTQQAEAEIASEG